MSPKEKIDSVWNSIWKDILENPDGSLDVDCVRRELHDYAVLFKSVQSVYSRLTGGEINHPFTPVDSVIAYTDLYYADMQQWASNQAEDQQEEFQEERASLFDIPYSKATIH